MFTTVDHTQFHDARDFLTEAHTACAMNAARHFLHGNQRSRIFWRNHVLLFTKARSAFTITHREVLQLAFTTLIANRTIQRVIEQ